MSEFPTSASVVIIGGGVMGTSTAFHLAEAGVTDVVLIERGQLGAGSTTKAAGGIRAQFSDAANIAISLRSIDLFEQFPSRPGQEIDLRKVGYLFLLTSPESVAVFERNVALQNSLGVPSRMISAEEAAKLNPLIVTDDVLAASFSLSDGLATPDSVVSGYARGARSHGARLVIETEVTGVEKVGDRIVGVTTSKGRIATETVICTAGAWSRSVGEMVGFTLDVSPLRREILFTGPIPGMSAEALHGLPMTIDFGSTFYFHGEGPGVLMGMSDQTETPGFKMERSRDFEARIAEQIERRAPSLLDAEVRGGWAGLYEVTPDHNSLIGEAGTVSRFLYCAGFSGHGFQQGPVAGEIMRDLFLGDTPTIDVSGLSADRLRAGEERREFNIV